MMVDLSPLSGTNFENLKDFLYFIINYAVAISTVVAVASIILAGFKYMLSMGDEKKIKSATNSLMYSLIGLVLVFIAPIVIEFVIKTILQA